LVCGAQYQLAIFENCFDESIPLTRRLVGDHNGQRKDLQFDKTKIVTGSSDHTVKIWDVEEFSCDGTIDLKGVVSCVKLCDNILFSHVSGTTIKVHDLNTLQCTFTKQFSSSVPDSQQIDLSDDGRTLVIASSMVYVFDTRSGLVVNCFGSNPHRQTICHGVANNTFLCEFKEDFTLYDVFTGKSVMDFEGSGYSEVKCMYSNFGIVAAGFDYCDVRLWDVQTGNIITDIDQACVLAPECVMFDESRLICGSAQTKANMYMFGNIFEDEVGPSSEFDKGVIRKWNTRMQFYK